MKYCTKCGAEIEDSESICKACAQENEQQEVKEVKKPARNVLALIGFGASMFASALGLATLLLFVVDPNIASVIYGILGIFAYMIVGGISLLLSVGGLIWTLVAKQRGKWFAITGIIVVSVGLIAVAVFLGIS